MNRSGIILGHRAFFVAIILWYSALILGVIFGNHGGSLSATDKAQFLQVGFILSMPLAGLVLTFIGSPDDYFRRLTPIARYFVAYVLVMYGFSKLKGGQFFILDSELDKPMGLVSPFWLTWYFFSYSEVYGAIIAGVQIFGSILLVFQRTALLGACLLAPVVGNILMIDIFYHIRGPIPIVLMLAGALFIIISERAQELIDLFWKHPVLNGKSSGWIAQGYFGAWLGLQLWSLVAIKIHPGTTPLDGSWTTAEVSPATLASEVPPTLFFEKKKSFCVFKDKSGSYQKNHFEVDTKTQTVTIWALKGWDMESNDIGAKIFEGKYEVSGKDMWLRGQYDKDQATLHLVRRAPLQPEN